MLAGHQNHIHLQVVCKHFECFLPRILLNEKIDVKKINSDDDSLESLYEKLVGGAQWK